MKKGIKICCGLLLCCLQFLAFNSLAQTQIGQDIDGEAAGDESGNSVSMPDAHTVAIGAPHNDGSGSSSGHVRIYTWNGSAWVQKGMDIDGEAAGDRSGRSVSMPDAHTVAIGAPYNDGTSSVAGHVRIYTWNGSAWIQKGMDIDGEALGDESGSVSMPDAHTVAIGAIGNDGTGPVAGHVRIYTWNGSAWAQKGMDIDGEAAGDRSGWSVSMPDASTVAIGAYTNDGTGSNAGHVRVYTWNPAGGGTWVQKGADIDGEAANNSSGWSVSMPDASTVAIGAHSNDGTASNSGHVRIYTWNPAGGGTWVQKGADIDGEAADDGSGYSVSMPDANTVAIGARNNDGTGPSAGHVRIYTWNPAGGGTWVQKGMDIDGEAAGDQSGNSVSMPNAHTVAIGASRNSGTGTDAGHVRIYDLCITTTRTDVQTACDSYTWIDGNTYTASNNTATDTLTNAAGCDSVVTLDLTINENTFDTVDQTVCDSLISPSGDYTWKTSGTYHDTLANAAGCDSIITFNLTVVPSKHTTIAPAATAPYTVPSGSASYYSTGTYYDTLNAANNCDSILTINLTIHNTFHPRALITHQDSSDSAFIGNVAIHNPAPGEDFLYTIVTGNEDNIFSIVDTTGDLLINIADSLDAASTPKYVLEVEALGSLGFTDTTVVTINIQGDFVPIHTGFGKSLYFDDADSNMVAAYPNGLPVGNQERTVAFWFKPSDNNALLFGYGTRHQERFFIRYNNGEVLLSNGTFEGTFYKTVSNEILPQNRWHHIAVTTDGSITKTYINGQFQSSFSHVYNTQLENGEVVYYLGRTPYFYGGVDFKGNIDEVAIWKRALSYQEVVTTTHTTPDLQDTTLVSYLNFEENDSTTIDDIAAGTSAQLVNYSAPTFEESVDTLKYGLYDSYPNNQVFGTLPYFAPSPYTNNTFYIISGPAFKLSASGELSVHDNSLIATSGQTDFTLMYEIVSLTHGYRDTGIATIEVYHPLKADTTLSIPQLMQKHSVLGTLEWDNVDLKSVFRTSPLFHNLFSFDSLDGNLSIKNSDTLTAAEFGSSNFAFDVYDPYTTYSHPFNLTLNVQNTGDPVYAGYGNALDFSNGQSLTMEKIPSSAFSNGRTVSLWINPQNASGPYFSLADIIFRSTYIADCHSGFPVSYDNFLTQNKWQHVSITEKDDYLKIYLNAELIVEKPIHCLRTNTQEILNQDCAFDNVTVWNRVLPAEEVLSLYKGQINTQDSTLRLYVGANQENPTTHIIAQRLGKAESIIPENQDFNEFIPSLEQPVFISAKTNLADTFYKAIGSQPNDQPLQFSLYESKSNKFNINAQTGGITLKHPDSLSLPQDSLINLSYAVNELTYGGADSATIQLRVLSRFTLSDSTQTIDEYPSLGQIIQRVKIENANPQEKYTYAIHSGNYNNSFNINDSTGEIVVANNDSLLTDITSTIALGIEATEQGTNLKDSAMVTINLADTPGPVYAGNGNFSIVNQFEAVNFPKRPQGQSAKTFSAWFYKPYIDTQFRLYIDGFYLQFNERFSCEFNDRDIPVTYFNPDAGKAQPQHVLVTMKPGKSLIYMNGALVDSSLSTNIYNSDSTNTAWHGGFTSATTEIFGISEMAVWDTALTDSAAKSIFKHGINRSHPKLARYYPMNQVDENTTPVDFSGNQLHGSLTNNLQNSTWNDQLDTAFYTIPKSDYIDVIDFAKGWEPQNDSIGFSLIGPNTADFQLNADNSITINPNNNLPNDTSQVKLSYVATDLVSNATDTFSYNLTILPATEAIDTTISMPEDTLLGTVFFDDVLLNGNPNITYNYKVISATDPSVFAVGDTSGRFELFDRDNIDLDQVPQNIVEIEITNDFGFLDTATLAVNYIDKPNEIYTGFGNAFVSDTVAEQYFHIHFPDSLDLSGQNATVETWVKINALESKTYPFLYSESFFGIRFEYNHGNLSMRAGGEFATLPIDTAWHHLAVTYSKQNNKLVYYFDGDSIEQRNASSGFGFGRYLTNQTSTSNVVHGTKIDNIKIYNKAFSKSEVFRSYKYHFNQNPDSLLLDVNFDQNQDDLYLNNRANTPYFGTVVDAKTATSHLAPSQVYYDSIPQSVQAYDTIGYVSASTDFRSSEFRFAKASENFESLSLDSITGLITIPPTLDLSGVTGTHELRFQATDITEGVVDTGIFLLEIGPVPTQLAPTLLLVDENTPAGDTIGFRRVLNPDSNTTYSYHIIDGNTGNTFGIDTLTSEIFVANNDSLDADRFPQFTLQVVAKGIDTSTFVDTAEITIDVNDLVEPVYVGFGPSLEFDGIDDYVKIDGNLIQGDQPFTVSNWARQPQPQSSFREMWSTQNRIYLGQDSNDGMRAGDGWGSNATWPTDGRWHHYTLVNTDSSKALYIDGQLVDTDNSRYFTSPVANEAFFIGNQRGGAENFGGYIDEVKIYHTAVTSSQVIEIMRNGPTSFDTSLIAHYSMNQVASDSLYDVSGNNNNGYFVNFAGTDSSLWNVTADSIQFYVQENAPAADSVGFLAAHDPDYSNLTYTLTGGDTSLFEADTATGLVRLIQGGLDHSTDSVHYLNYKVMEDGDNQVDSGTVQINVVPYPAYDTVSVTIDENPSRGDTLVTHSVTYSLNDRSFVYRLLDTTLVEIIGIDSTTGTLTATNTNFFNHEIRDSVTISIAVHDQMGYQDTGAVTVYLNDVTEPVYAGFGNALDFNANNYVETDEVVVPATGNFTVSVWARQNSLQPGNNYIILSQNAASAANRFFIGGTSGSQSEVLVGASWLNTHGVGFPSDLEWHNYTVVKRSGDAELYIDGILMANRGATIPNPDASSLKIGTQYNVSQGFNGRIDEVKVWGTDLAPEEIKSHFGETSTPADTSLSSYYKFDQIHSDTVYDFGTSSFDGYLVNLDADTDYVESADTTLALLAEDAVNGTEVHKGSAIDPDSSSLTFTLISGDTAFFAMNDSTGSITVTEEDSIDFETDSILYLAYSVTESGDNQADTATVEIRLQDRPDPYFTDMEIVKAGVGYATVPRSQYNGINVHLTNHGPETYRDFHVRADWNAVSDSVFVDSLVFSTDTVINIPFPQLATTYGEKQVDVKLQKDTFDLEPANDSLRTVFAITDSVYSRNTVPGTGSGIGLDGGALAVAPGEQLGARFDVNNTDTLTSASFYLQDLAPGDSFSVKLYTFSNAPDSLLDSVLLVPGSVADTLYTAHFNCFHYLEPGSYLIAIQKRNLNASAAKLGVNDSLAEVPANWFTDVGGTWQQLDTNSVFGVNTSLMIKANLGGDYQYPDLILNYGDTASICLNDTIGLYTNSIYQTEWNSVQTDTFFTSVEEWKYVEATLNGFCRFTDSLYLVNDTLPTFSIAADTICTGDTATVTLETGYSFQWFDGASDTSREFVVQGGYGVSRIDNNGCAASDTFRLTLDTLPTVTLNPITAICENSPPVEITGGTPAGGTYQGNQLLNDTLDVAGLTENDSSVVNYTFTDLNGCTSSDTAVINIKKAPDVAISFPFSAVCENEPAFELTGGLPFYGTFNGPGIKNDSLFTDTLTSGVYTVELVADSANGCADSTTTAITVDPAPYVDSLVLDDYCLNDSLQVLSGGFPQDGIYSGNGVANDSIFNPAAAGTGVVDITYTRSAGGCSDSLTASITVNVLPLTTLSAIPSLCENDSVLNLVPFANDTAAGSFSGTGVAGFGFDPQVAGTDTHQVRFARTNQFNCTTADTQAVVVLEKPQFTFNTLPAICEYDSLNLFNASAITPAGGYFAGPFVTDSVFDPDSAGTYTVKYFYTDTSTANSCNDSVAFNITVNPEPVVSLNLQFGNICIDSANTVLQGGTPTGGVYDTDSSIVLSGNQYIFYPSAAGQGWKEVTYRYTTSQGCESFDVDSIYVDSLPKVSISTIPAICSGSDTVHLDTFPVPRGGSFTGDAVYYDAPGDVYYFEPDSGVLGASNIINYFYTDTATGCSNNTSGLITLNPNPSVSLSSIQTFCMGDTTFHFTQFSPAGGVFSGPGTDSSSIVFEPDSAGQGNHNIVYAYTNSFGCSNKDSITVTVNGLPNVSLDASAYDTICFASPPFTLSGGTPAGGNYSGTNVSLGQYNPVGVGVGADTVSYSYTNPSTGCSSSDTASINIMPLPQPGLNLVNDSVCNAVPTFTLTGGTSTGGGIAQQYYSGTGVSSDSLFSASSLSPGIYAINYILVDSVGCTDSTSQNITIHPQPSITYNAITPICLTDTAVVSANTSGAANWNYRLISNTTNTIDSTTGHFTANEARLDSIRFTLTDFNGCTDSMMQTIQVDTLPNVQFAAISDRCENGLPISLNQGTPMGGDYYLDDSLLVGSVTPAAIGVGTDTLKYGFTDANGCADSAFQSVLVNAPPTVSLADYPEVCDESAPVTLNQGSPSGGSYSSAQVTIMNDSIFDPSTVVPGTYDITYSYTDTNSCTETAVKALTVNPLPNVQFTGSLPDVCVNYDSLLLDDKVNFQASPPTGYFTGPGVDSVGGFGPATAGVGGHNVFYTYTDTNNCTNTTSATIIVHQLPEPEMSQSAVEICQGDSAVLQAEGGETYLWETGDTARTIEVRPDSSKWFAVTVTDQFSCSQPDSILQQVYTSFNVRAEKDSTTTRLNQPVTFDLLTNDRGNIFEYEVIGLPANGTLDESMNPDITYTPNSGFRRTDSLEYRICDDFCPSVCDTNIAIVKVFGEPKEFIPSGFSPNGDGINDRWIVPGIQLYPENTLVIVNRYGDKVFEASPYTNNWRGQSEGALSFGGEQLPDGTYYYVLKLGDGTEMTGTIELKSQ